MNEPDHLADFSAALAAYFSALDIVCECVSEVCPEVGKLSSQRIGKLRARLSFQPTREAIRESTITLRRELIKHYAVNASMQVERHEIEFERGMAAVQHIVNSLTRLNESSAAQLRQLAAEWEAAELPAEGEPAGAPDSKKGKAVPARQAAKIKQCAETLVSETALLSGELREEIAAVEARLVGPAVVDPVTGLLTRAEVLRRIRSLNAEDITHNLLVFEIGGHIGNAVLRQVATKLSTHFRHQDMLARWAEREFLVVFQGAAKYAEARIPHVAAGVSGRYYDENDRAVDIAVTVRMEQHDWVAA
jgi:GGDEF domain-containing protein